MKFIIKISLILYLNLFHVAYSQQQISSYLSDRSVLDPAIAPFYHGVASGDPLSDRVVIWTHVTSQEASDTVRWYFATDSLMQQRIQQGTTITNSLKNHSVKEEILGLQPNTYYYYMFECRGRYSQVGRTKTMPIGDAANMRIGVVNCTNYSYGYFNAYDILNARNDVDFIIHLGDYIYEDGYQNSGVDTIRRRVFPEYDAYDKPSYEMRYSWYRLDPSLRELHRQYPWVIIWDDHEFANDAARDTALRHYPLTQGSWAKRKNAAIEAFKEWIPCREDSSRSNIINHIQKIGNLADIIYTENRIQRDTLDNGRQFLNIAFGAGNPLQYANPTLTTLGQTQINQICHELKNSTARWKIMANQIVFSPYVFKGPFSFKTRHPSSWDYYPWDRKKILDTVAHFNIKNFVVLSGDVHIAMAFEIVHDSIPYNQSNSSGAMGVEFVCDNVVDGGIFGNMEDFMYTNNPHLKYMNTTSQGFYILDIRPDRVCCDYWQSDSVKSVSTSSTFLKSYCTNNNASHLTHEQTPSSPINTYPPLLSYLVNVENITKSTFLYSNVELLNVYPNPVQSYIRLQYFLRENNEIAIYLYDVIGQLIKTYPLGSKAKGLHEEMLEIPDVALGQYLLDFVIGDQHTTKKIIVQ